MSQQVVAYIALLCAVACSGQAEQSHGGSGGSAGQATGLGGTPASGGNADAVAGEAARERSIYDEFMREWLVARSQREPGEPIPPVGAEARCFDCVTSRGSAMCRYPAGSDCAPYTACIERHCLDTESYPASLYDCVQSCLPLDDVSCHAQWLEFVTCAVPACAASCG